MADDGYPDSGDGAAVLQQKQLPLRQQRNKPVLKYSGHGNSYLNPPTYPPSLQRSSADEMVYTKQAMSTEVLAGYMNATAGVTQCVYPAQFMPRTSQVPFPNYMFNAGMGAKNGMSLTQAQILSANIAKYNHASGAINPYTRPFSACDIQSPDGYTKRGQNGVVTNIATLARTSSSGCIDAKKIKSGMNGTLSHQTIQTNAFMRPRSASRSEGERSTNGNSRGKGSSSLTTHNLSTNHTVTRDRGYVAGDSLYVKPPQDGSTEPIRNGKIPHGGDLGNRITDSHYTIGDVGKPVTPQSAETFYANKIMPRPPTFDKTRPGIEKPAEVAGTKTSAAATTVMKRVGNVYNGVTKNSQDVFQRPPVTATMAVYRLHTGSNTAATVAAGKGMTGSQHPIGSVPMMTGTAIHNPNYTPAKPYNEQSSGSLSSSTSASGSPTTSSYTSSASSASSAVSQRSPTVLSPSTCQTSSCPQQQPTNTEASNNIDLLSKTKSNPIGRPPSGTTTYRKMPVTNTTVTGTVYYRKLSKAEEVIRDLSKRPAVRAAGDGAAAQQKVSQEDLSRRLEEATNRKREVGSARKTGDTSSETVSLNSERVPGDGEDFDAEWGVDDDEAIDGIDEDIADDSSGDDSDICPTEGSTSKVRLHTATKRMLGLSLHSRASSATASPDHTTRTVTMSPTRVRALSAVSTISSDSDLQVALMPSLFPYVPPTINFVLDGQKVESLPWEIRRMLKWRMSPITPNVVKHCIARSHFKITRRSYDWIGYFGKHMKAQGFKAIREYQKVNHFPGSFQMGRKDRLWRNLSRLQVHYGKREFNFFPQTFVLPIDAKLLKRAWDEGGHRHKWIIKPPASARGIGIRVIHKWNQIPKRRQVIVQRYLSRPYLINGSKFDLRLYVYVTSYDPLRIYLYDDGLVRFASCKYSYSTKTLSNRYMHLTNYSINKRNDGYKQNDDENVCQGHKWALKALWGYLKKYGINTAAIWENIKDIILKTVISSETFINSLVKSNVRRRYSCHELFGFDIFLDETLKPWIIEVNISPSLHSNSPLDMNIKGGMVKDMLNLAGFQIPDRSEVVSVPGTPPPPSKYTVPKGICIDKRLWPTATSHDERTKHSYYVQRHADESIQSTVLDIITPDDLRILVESIDEDSRRGNFQRIFPSLTSQRYQQFFDAQRYYNILLQTWVLRYNRLEAKGIMLLESLCQKRLHLMNPTTDTRHHWVPSRAFMSRVVSAPAIALTKTAEVCQPLPRLRRRRDSSVTTSQSGSSCCTPSGGTASQSSSDTNTMSASTS